MSSGAVVELYTGQGRAPLAHVRAHGLRRPLRPVYDKSARANVIVCEGGKSASLDFVPARGKSLALSHRFCAVHVLVPHGSPWALEIVVADGAHRQRRIFFSTSFRSLDSTPLHARVPLVDFPRAVWVLLTLDLAALTAALFRSAEYGELVAVALRPSCRLRRAVACRAVTPLPRILEFPLGIANALVHIDDNMLRALEQESASRDDGSPEGHVNASTLSADPALDERRAALTSTQRGHTGPMHVAFGRRHPLPAFQTPPRTAQPRSREYGAGMNARLPMRDVQTVPASIDQLRSPLRSGLQTSPSPPRHHPSSLTPPSLKKRMKESMQQNGDEPSASEMPVRPMFSPRARVRAAQGAVFSPPPNDHRDEEKRDGLSRDIQDEARDSFSDGILGNLPSPSRSVHFGRARRRRFDEDSSDEEAVSTGTEDRAVAFEGRAAVPARTGARKQLFRASWSSDTSEKNAAGGSSQDERAQCTSFAAEGTRDSFPSTARQTSEINSSEDYYSQNNNAEDRDVHIDRDDPETLSSREKREDDDASERSSASLDRTLTASPRDHRSISDPPALHLNSPHSHPASQEEVHDSPGSGSGARASRISNGVDSEENRSTSSIGEEVVADEFAALSVHNSVENRLSPSVSRDLVYNPELYSDRRSSEKRLSSTWGESTLSVSSEMNEGEEAEHNKEERRKRSSTEGDKDDNTEEQHAIRGQNARTTNVPNAPETRGNRVIVDDNREECCSEREAFPSPREDSVPKRAEDEVIFASAENMISRESTDLGVESESARVHDEGNDDRRVEYQRGGSRSGASRPTSSVLRERALSPPLMSPELIRKRSARWENLQLTSSESLSASDKDDSDDGAGTERDKRTRSRRAASETDETVLHPHSAASSQYQQTPPKDHQSTGDSAEDTQTRHHGTAVATPRAANREQDEPEEGEDTELDLMFDPILNCYYDPKTNKYYELK